MQALKSAALLSWRFNWYVLLIFCLYAGGGYVASRFYGFDLSVGIFRGGWLFLPVMLICGAVILWWLGTAALTLPSNPLQDLIAFLKRLRVVDRIAIMAPAMLVMSMFFSVYASMKLAIGDINPFNWDRTFASLDEALHGQQPWELLHPLLAIPAVTETIDILYILWIPLMLIVTALVSGWVSNPLLRAQYLITFMLSWVVLGSISAVIFSSVGPCFYGLLLPTEPNPFAALMEYLEHVNGQSRLASVLIQHNLWYGLESRQLTGGAGISAMPSIHLAVATLLAILAWQLSRFLGLVATIYLGIILIGSVHLGWHYAVDGYVSIAAVPLIWKATGWMIAKYGSVNRISSLLSSQTTVLEPQNAPE